MKATTQAHKCVFPKSARILHRKHFQDLAKDSEKFEEESLKIRYRLNRVVSPKLGLIISKSYGNAVSRNLFKRRMRELFRKSYHLLPQGIEIVVYAKKLTDFQAMKRDFHLFISQFDHAE